MSGSNIPIPSELQAKLARLDQHLRRLALLRGLGIVAVVGASALGLGLSADAWWSAGPTLRWFLVTGVAALVGYAAWRSLLRPSWRIVNGVELASLVDAAHPALAERLSSAVEVCLDGSPEISASNFLRKRLADEAAAQTDQLEFAKTVSSRPALRWLALGGMATMLLLTPFAVSPASYGLLWARLLVPWGNFETAGNLYFRVSDGDHVVTRNSDVVIRTELAARRGTIEHPQHVYLTKRDGSPTSHSRRMTYSATSGVYEITLPHVRESFDFHLTAGEHRSRTYQVVVVDSPQLTELKLEISPPVYTRLPAQHFDGALGEIEVVEQSQLRFEARYNKPIAAAHLRWLAGPGRTGHESESNVVSVPFDVAPDARSATLDMQATSGGPYVLEVRDSHGFETAADQPRTLVIVPDQPPQLFLEEDHNELRQIDPYDTLAVQVSAADDFGVEALELHYETDQQQEGVIQADGEILSSPSIEHEFRIGPATLGLRDGSTLTYRIRAADGRPVPGPNEVWSKRYTVAIDSNADALTEAELARQQAAFREALQTLHEGVSNSRDEVGKLLQNSQDDRDVDTLTAAKRGYQHLSTELQNLSDQAEQLASAFDESPLYSNLTGDLQDVSRDRLVPARRLVDASADQPADEQDASLENAHEHLTEAERQLAEIGDRFEELVDIENDLLELNRLARAAAQLAMEARDLQRLDNGNRDERKENGDEHQLEERYEQLEDQQQALTGDLQDLLERRPELVEAALGEVRDRLLAVARQLTDVARPELLIAESLKDQSRRTEPVRAGSESAPDEKPVDPTSAAKSLLASQQKITSEAARLALDIAQTLGPLSESAELAIRWVQAGTEGVESVMAGQFEQAAEQGRQASILSRRLVEELRRRQRDDNASDLVSRTRTLLQRRLDLNQKLRQLAPSQAVQQAAREVGQQQIIRATSALVSELHHIESELAKPPFEEPVAVKSTGAARDSAVRARGLMQYARTHLRELENETASRRAVTANRALINAARYAEAAAESIGVQESPVPGEVGEQVTQAAQQLADAGQRLAQARDSSPQQSNQAGQDQQSQETGSPGQQQASAQGEQSGPGGEGESSQQSAASDLEQAADSLAQAARQMQPGGGRQGQAGRQSADAGQTEQASESPGDTSTAGGVGARSTVDLQELESDWRNQLSRDWGRLPGKLQTEILQSARKTPRGDYARLIKLYFEELAKPIER